MIDLKPPDLPQVRGRFLERPSVPEWGGVDSNHRPTDYEGGGTRVIWGRPVPLSAATCGDTSRSCRLVPFRPSGYAPFVSTVVSTMAFGLDPVSRTRDRVVKDRTPHEMEARCYEAA